MQWTLYGLPMYAVKTGIAAGGHAEGGGPARRRGAGGGIAVACGELRPGAGGASRRGQGLEVAGLEGTEAASLPTLPDAAGPALRLHGAGRVHEVRLARATSCRRRQRVPGPERLLLHAERSGGACDGAGDLPIQPYFVYDSRLSGTSQHGVLWKGGTLRRGDGLGAGDRASWSSNGGDGSNHGSSAAGSDDAADGAADGAGGGPGRVPAERPGAEQPGGGGGRVGDGPGDAAVHDRADVPGGGPGGLLLQQHADGAGNCDRRGRSWATGRTGARTTRSAARRSSGRCR